MTGSSALDAVALSSRSQQAARAAVVAGAVLFLLVVPAAGGDWHPVASGLVLLVALLAGLVPETHAGLGLVLSLGALWAWSGAGLGLWALVAAALLLAVHLGCALASYGPPGLALDPVLLALWRSRALLGLAAAAGVWVLAEALAVLDLAPSRAAVGVGLLLVLGWVAALATRLWPGERD